MKLTKADIERQMASLGAEIQSAQSRLGFAEEMERRSQALHEKAALEVESLKRSIDTYKAHGEALRKILEGEDS